MNEDNDLSQNKSNNPEALSAEQSPSTNTGTTSDANNVNVTEVGNNKTEPRTKKILMSLVLVFATLIVGVGAWFLLGQDNTEQQSATKQNLKEIELLKIGSVEGPANNLFPAEASSGVNASANYQIFEGLVENNHEKFTPLLAESWTNPDQSTWVFKLKPDVKFHTGKIMTADDVKKSIEKQKEIEFWESFATTITSVEATGDLEVTVKTSNPDALLLNRLSKVFIVDTDENAVPGNNGTGAFSLDTDAINNETSMKLKSFAGHHRGEPLTKSLEYIIFDDESSVQTALKNGEVDIIEQNAKVAELSSDSSNYKSLVFEAGGSNGIYLNLLKEDSPLNNLKVRQAIALVVDRQALVDEIGDPGFVPAFQMVPKSLAGYDSELEPTNPDIEKAKTLLIEAGYQNGVTLDFIYFAGVQAEPPIIIAQLQEAGFTINATAYEKPDEIFGAVESKSFDLFMSSYYSDIMDASDVFGSVSISRNPRFAAVDDKEFDALLAASDTEFDPIRRTESLVKINKYITNNVLWIPVRNSSYTTYYRQNLQLSANSDVDISSIAYREVGEIVAE